MCLLVTFSDKVYVRYYDGLERWLFKHQVKGAESPNKTQSSAESSPADSIRDNVLVSASEVVAAGAESPNKTQSSAESSPADSIRDNVLVVLDVHC